MGTTDPYTAEQYHDVIVHHFPPMRHAFKTGPLVLNPSWKRRAVEVQNYTESFTYTFLTVSVFVLLGRGETIGERGNLKGRRKRERSSDVVNNSSFRGRVESTSAPLYVSPVLGCYYLSDTSWAVIHSCCAHWGSWLLAQ